MTGRMPVAKPRREQSLQPQDQPLVVVSRPDIRPRQHFSQGNQVNAQHQVNTQSRQSSGAYGNLDSSTTSTFHFVEHELSASFYTNPPQHRPAIFSTKQGELPFREMKHFLPGRSVHMWDQDEIQSACNSLRLLYWDLMKTMQRPVCWEHMWKWFDSHDLYYYGAWNLWNVINHLFDENRLIHADVKKEFALHIGHWADEWCAKPANEEKLRAWTPVHGAVFRLLTSADHKNMGPINDDVIPMISDALKHRRHLLIQDPERAATKPKHLLQACLTNNVHNWMGKSCPWKTEN